MRAPQNAGEIKTCSPPWRLPLGASMRPPQNAGEIAGAASGSKRTSTCFNEAPAKRGGNLPVPSLNPSDCVQLQ